MFSWLGILSGITGLFGKILKWFLSLPWYEIVIILLGVVCLVEYGLLREERSHARKLDARLHTCMIVQQQLVQKSQQKEKIVTKTVDHYIRVDRPVIQKEVQRIETAPITGVNQTPKEVLDADI